MEYKKYSIYKAIIQEINDVKHRFRPVLLLESDNNYKIIKWQEAGLDRPSLIKIREILNYELTNEDKQLFDNNTVKVNDTEYDEYGRPRLEAGHDKESSHYTFKDNGMGEPVEALPKGIAVSVTNPNIIYSYATFNNKWSKSTAKQSQEWMDKVQGRQMSATGIPYEERKISTDEEIHNYVQGMAINMGSGAGN